jgi:predicted RNase H-like HicB family nuclease
MKYTVVIQWSEEDRCLLVFLPEFEDVMQPVTHGDSYEEAIKNAQEVIELLIESYEEEGKPLPETKKVWPLFQVA